MPELPDLWYIEQYLRRHVVGRQITDVSIKRPVVIRSAAGVPFADTLRGKKVTGVRIHGPFLHFTLTERVDLIMNFMLTGRLQHQRTSEKEGGHRCFNLTLDDGSKLNYLDDQMMGKIYLTRSGEYSQIPRFLEQGLAIRSPAYTLKAFRALLKDHGRKQVHVVMIDQTLLSAIGHAYADEILFEAGIHPKTWVRDLSEEQMSRLHTSIRNVIDWGFKMVSDAREPIHVKVRDHMKVRLRHGKPCTRCGTKIRREGVRGWDVYFCPKCQPATRPLFIDWNRMRHTLPR